MFRVLGINNFEYNVNCFRLPEVWVNYIFLKVEVTQFQQVFFTKITVFCAPNIFLTLTELIKKIFYIHIHRNVSQNIFCRKRKPFWQTWILILSHHGSGVNCSKMIISFFITLNSLEVIEEDVGGLVQVVVCPDQRLLHPLAGEAHVSQCLINIAFTRMIYSCTRLHLSGYH